MDENELKRKFAVAMIAKPDDAFKIAFALYPDPKDTPLAAIAANTWPRDPVVLAFMQDAGADPMAAGVLPDKHQAASEILARARACRDDETYGKLMRLYADMMGQVEKAGTSSASVVINNNKVIVMPAPLTKDAWTLKASQHKLIDVPAKHA